MPSNGWLESECNDAHTALPERSSDLSIERSLQCGRRLSLCTALQWSIPDTWGPWRVDNTWSPYRYGGLGGNRSTSHFHFEPVRLTLILISSFMPRCVSGVPVLINVKTFQQTRVLMHILLISVPSIRLKQSRSMPFESWCKTSTPEHSWRRCCFCEWLLSPYRVLTWLFCSSSGDIQTAELEMDELDGWSTSISKNKHDIIPRSQAQAVLPYTPVRMTPFSFIAIVIVNHFEPVAKVTVAWLL